MQRKVCPGDSCGLGIAVFAFVSCVYLGNFTGIMVRMQGIIPRVALFQVREI
jgi:hypothetical protein